MSLQCALSSLNLHMRLEEYIEKGIVTGIQNFRHSPKNGRCPENLGPDYSNTPLRTVFGQQDDYIKPEGIKTFFAAEYKLSSFSDKKLNNFVFLDMN